MRSCVYVYVRMYAGAYLCWRAGMRVCNCVCVRMCDRGTYRSVSKPGLPRFRRMLPVVSSTCWRPSAPKTRFVAPAPGDHRIHLPRREIVSHVADLLLDMRRAVGFQNVPDHGVPPLRIYADADVWVCADARLSVCVCMPKRLRAHPHPPWYQCRGAESFETSRAASATLPGDGFSAAEDAAAFRAPAAMEAGVLPGLTQP